MRVIVSSQEVAAHGDCGFKRRNVCFPPPPAVSLMHRKGDGCFLNLNITTKKEEKKASAEGYGHVNTRWCRERELFSLWWRTHENKAGWWVTGSKCTGAKEKVEANRNPGQHRHNNKHIRTHKCTSQLLIGNKERVSVLNWRWQAWSRKQQTGDLPRI